MQNRYTGDIGDFGKFLLLKHLFPNERIGTIWYLYPDETHNNDGRHKVEENNRNIYHNCHTLDAQMSELFQCIHHRGLRDISAFEQLSVLEHGHYFSESVLGAGQEFRNQWLDRGIKFIQSQTCSVVCLDPDNGIETSSMHKLSQSKQGKYCTYREIDSFFIQDCVNHLVIYQHFHRQQPHETQMREAKAKFERLYEGRAAITIIRHNPVQARFYIILSKRQPPMKQIESLQRLKYGSIDFFEVLKSNNN